MKRNVCGFIGVAALLLSVQAMAQITFYEGEGFRGRAFTTSRAQSNFTRSGFNDRASSVVVDRGTWEVCDDASFQGRCVVLRPGAYDSLRRLGVNDRLSSARPVNSRGRDRGNYGNDGPEPLPVADYDYRRRPNERVYEAQVTSVHAIVGPPDRRCWVEREQVESRGGRNVAGGVVGAVIGGILGHQIGYGRGNDAATVGGAVVGAAIGSNQGRDSGDTRTTDVRHCETAANGDPDYWDVTYSFRNVDHRIQMTAPPGRTIYVNRDGLPRQ
jgi:uncharacterized protein YcfJ